MDTKNKLVVGDELYDVPGLEVLGLYSGMAGRLAGPVRKAMATEVIVHESVTRSATDTYRI